MRRSRHLKPDSKPDFDLRANARSLATLQLFDRYRILPLNWMHALADDGNYAGYRDLCTRLWRAGLLERKTLNGQRNNNETQSYKRTEAGCRYLHGKGFDALHHDTQGDVHQSLVDLAEAHIELGARAHGVEYHPWLDIRDHPLTPPLPDRPFRFHVNDTILVPDGRPFYLKTASGSLLFLRELDRNTEVQSTIEVKLRHYRLLHEKIQQRYGFKHAMLLFITTNKTREQNILKWIAAAFDGSCKWILTQTIDDHIKQCRSTVPVTTHLFDAPYSRAGCRPFSLKTLGEIT